MQADPEEGPDQNAEEIERAEEPGKGELLVPGWNQQTDQAHHQADDSHGQAQIRQTAGVLGIKPFHMRWSDFVRVLAHGLD
jgi:hypothetical protein